jgi:large subunit ribosomal protein L4e
MFEVTETFCRKQKRSVKKLNPLTNTRALLRLNPYAAVLKRKAILTSLQSRRKRQELLAKKRGVRICFNLLVRHAFAYM